MQVLTLVGLLGLLAGVANAGVSHLLLDQGNFTKIEKEAANTTVNITAEEEEASPTMPSLDVTTLPTINKTEQDCYDQIGKIQDDAVMNTMPKYDIEQILEGLGGAPGKLNVTRRNDTKEVVISDENLKERPFPDADEEYWLYDYRTTDYKTFVRREHALLRFNGTEQEFEDVRGEVWWSPPDFCNLLRYATYRLDDTGFHQDVSLLYCWLGVDEGTLSCAGPARCVTTDSQQYCVAAPSASLIASLVG